MNPNEKVPTLLSPEEVSMILQIKISTLSNWRSRKLGPPFIKLPSGSIRYELKALNEYINAGHKPASTP